MFKQWLRAVAPAVALVVLVSAALGQQAPAAAPPAGQPKNVIVMISDGMGPAAVALTRLREAIISPKLPASSTSKGAPQSSSVPIRSGGLSKTKSP